MDEPQPLLTVTLAWSPAPRDVRERVMQLPAGATVRQAIEAAADLLDGADKANLTLGIWGRAADPAQRLAEGDRIELCRPLRVDPKVARRERFRQQGARGAGLFAQRRPGAKPGY